MTLTNNCGIYKVFDNYLSKCEKLFKNELFLHHYLEFMDKDYIQGCIDNVKDIKCKYQEYIFFKLLLFVYS